MRYINILFVLLFVSNSLCAQTTLLNGTSVRVFNGTTVSSSEDLHISDNADLQNNGTLIFKKNLTNLGTSILTGKFIASGVDRQYINGAASYTFVTLNVNNSAGVYLDSRIDIVKELKLEKGVLFTNPSNPIVFANDADNPLETTDGYIYGTAIMLPRHIEQNSIDFLGCSVAIPTGSIGDIAITRTTGDNAIMTIGDSKTIAAKWEVETEEQLKDNIDISLSWLPAFDNGTEILSLGLFANTEIAPEKFISVDKKTNYPVKINTLTDKRTYSRSGLDYANRTFTLANKNSLANTVPEASVTAFPNPVQDQLNLLLENFESWAQNAYIKITDATGVVFFESVYSINGNQITIDGLCYLPVGLYRVYISRGQLTKVVNFMKG